MLMGGTGLKDLTWMFEASDGNSVKEEVEGHCFRYALITQ